MKNAKQVRELLDVIEEQRGIVYRYAGELYSDRYEDEQSALIGMYDELTDLIEQELAS